jgi:hypothetical protein
VVTRLDGSCAIGPDGTGTPDFGDNPHGLVIFTADGRYSVEIYRADRAKFSSDDRAKVSTEEYKDAALGISVHFGRYTVDPPKHTINSCSAKLRSSP